MDIINQTISNKLSEHTKRCVRKQMDQTHDYDAKLLKLSDELIDIRREFGAQPRLSRLEDDLREVRKEIQVSSTASSILHISFSLFIACI